MFRVRAFLALAATTALALTGCAGTPDATGKVQVVAAFYPYQWVAQRIVGNLGEVATLTQPGAEPHDLELSARQIGSLVTADLVVYQAGFQPAVDDAVTQAGPAHVVDAAQVTPPVALPEQNAGAPDTDPHLWLDPTRLDRVASAVADALIAIHPEQADTLRANADALHADLTALDRDFRQGLASCTTRVFVTSHDAFGYLANRYDLSQVGISGLNPDVEPTAERVAEVHRIVKANEVTTVFFEPLASDAVATSAATDLDLEIAVLDPLEGLTEASPGTSYPDVMRANLTALRKANQCR